MLSALTVRDSHAEARSLIDSLLAKALQAAPAARRFASSLGAHTGIRMADMIDHVALAPGHPFPSLGWREDADGVWRSPDPLFPDVIDAPVPVIALRVECVARFLTTTGLEARLEGDAHGPFRRAVAFAGDGVRFDVVERRGWSGREPPCLCARKLRRAQIHQQIFRARRRHFRNPAMGLAHLTRLAEAAAADLGPAWAGALFLRAEREHWLTRCEAAAHQHRRQIGAGVGWCTIDHHAFASSRERAADAARILETLGHSPAGLASPRDADISDGALAFDARATGAAARTLLALDLEANERSETALRLPLSPLTWHGQAGLWAALHGESMLEAGLVTVAAAYDLVAFRQQLAEHGIVSERCDHGRLQREIVRGELRAVDPPRVEALERGGHLSREQAERYRLTGAPGAHFEAVQHDAVSDGFAPPAFDLHIPPFMAPTHRSPRRKRYKTRALV